MASLAGVTDQLQRQNQQELASVIRIANEQLVSSGARQGLDEIAKIFEQQQGTSLEEYKATKKQIVEMQRELANLDGVNSEEKRMLQKVLETSQTSIGENVTFKKSIGELTSKTVESSIDSIGGMIGGALSGSPLLSFGASFVGDRFKQFKENRKAAKEAQKERADKIAQEAEQEEREFSLLRSQMDNASVAAASGKTQEEIDSLSLDQLNEEKDLIIQRAFSAKQEADLQEEDRKRLESVQEKFGLDRSTNSPPPSSGNENNNDDRDNSGNRGAGESVSDILAGDQRREIISVLGDIDGRLHGSPDYLETLNDKIDTLIKDDPSSLDIENQRELRRHQKKMESLAQNKIKATRRSGMPGGAGKKGGGNEGSILDTLGDIGGAATVLGGLAGAFALFKKGGFKGLIKGIPALIGLSTAASALPDVDINANESDDDRKKRLAKEEADRKKAAKDAKAGTTTSSQTPAPDVQPKDPPKKRSKLQRIADGLKKFKPSSLLKGAAAIAAPVAASVGISKLTSLVGDDGTKVPTAADAEINKNQQGIVEKTGDTLEKQMPLKSATQTDPKVGRGPDGRFTSLPPKADVIPEVTKPPKTTPAKTGALDGAKKAMGNLTAPVVKLKDGAKKSVAGAIDKTVAKKILATKGAKMIAKAVPGVGIAAGGLFALSSLFRGDFVGAGLEAGGMFLPSLAGAPLDAAIMARETYNEMYGTDKDKFPFEKDRINDPDLANARMSELKDMALDAIGVAQKEIDENLPEKEEKVEARPEKNFFGGDAGQRKWDKMYGETHNPDGTVKAKENVSDTKSKYEGITQKTLNKDGSVKEMSFQEIQDGIKSGTVDRSIGRKMQESIELKAKTQNQENVGKVELNTDAQSQSGVFAKGPSAGKTNQISEMAEKTEGITEKYLGKEMTHQELEDGIKSGSVKKSIGRKLQDKIILTAKVKHPERFENSDRMESARQETQAAMPSQNVSASDTAVNNKVAAGETLKSNALNQGNKNSNNNVVGNNNTSNTSVTNNTQNVKRIDNGGVRNPDPAATRARIGLGMGMAF